MEMAFRDERFPFLVVAGEDGEERDEGEEGEEGEEGGEDDEGKESGERERLLVGLLLGEPRGDEYGDRA